MKENEEKKGDQPYLVRPGKLNQLKAARHKTLSSRSRGKGAALMATMTLLAAEGIATLQRTPSKGKKRGKWNWWIEDSAEWMAEAGSIAEGERGELVRKARLTASEYEIGGEPELRVLNLGEGWAEVDSQSSAEVLPDGASGGSGQERVHMDRPGFVEGYITAEVPVMHDWTQKSSAEGSDLITAVSKKAAVPVGAWDMIDLEPGCTLFSTANVHNVSRGCTHVGKHLDSPTNLASMTPERLAKEREDYAQARAGVVPQLLSLERQPDLTFLLENPPESELWYLPEVIEIIQRNPGWVIREIDRCAYGWREKKPSKIMTSRPAWVPEGRTGNGRCKAGKCTGWLTPSGQTEHPGQTCPNSKEKGLDTRDKRGGRYEN